MSSSDKPNPLFNKIVTSYFEEQIFPDLKVICFWILLTVCFIYVPILNDTPLRILVTLPMVLFIPGYSLIAALFPGNKDIDIIERVALSFGLSIAVVPLIGLGLNYSPFGIRLDPIVASLVIFSVGMVLIAQYMRANLSKDDRYYFPASQYVNQIKDDFLNQNDSRIDRILTIILIFAIFTAIITTVYVIVVPKEGEKFTEFFVLGEKKMAADYPTTLVDNEQYPMYVGVGNHEYRNVTYTVETYLMNMVFHTDTNSSTVSGMSLLNSTSFTLSHNETLVFPYNLSAKRDLSNFNRVEFLLYNETIPNDTVQNMDRINSSYRDLHLWVKSYSGT